VSDGLNRMRASSRAMTIEHALDTDLLEETVDVLRCGRGASVRLKNLEKSSAEVTDCSCEGVCRCSQAS
jgi:hypothetical protein